MFAKAPNAGDGVEWVGLRRALQGHQMRLPVIIISLALLAVAVASWQIALRYSPNPAPARTALSLRAERSGVDYRVTWDSASQPVLAATSGTLSIEDGTFKQDLELNREQLRNASLLYSPVSGDVTFRLRVSGTPRGSAMETIALHSDAPANPVVPGVQTPRIAIVSAPPAPDPINAEAPPERPALLVASRDFEMPKASPRGAAVLDAPVIEPGQAAILPASVAIPISQPQLPPAQAPAPAAPLKPVANSAPAYVPPRAVRQVPPALSSAVRNLIRSMRSEEDIRVEVEVQVDAAGNVASARALSDRDGLYRALSEPAIAAARLWKFAPATRGARPIEGRAIVSFQFTRPGS